MKSWAHAKQSCWNYSPFEACHKQTSKRNLKSDPLTLPENADVVSHHINGWKKVRVFA